MTEKLEHATRDTHDWDQRVLEMYEELEQQLLSYHAKADIALVRSAFEFAHEKHYEQRRKSGEPYIIHPLGVAMLVSQLKLDEASICASLLHDVVEDTDATYDDVKEKYGEEVVMLVDGLTKLDKYEFKSTEDRQAANFRKMLLAMNRDLRVILIKLADRVHNMRTLEHMKPEKQVRIAQETLDIYVPLSNRLGIDWIKTELENLSLRYLHPEVYSELAEKIDVMMNERKEYIDNIIGIIREALDKEGFKGYQLKGRIKHIYSIYRKLKRSVDMVFENLHDIIAFRIIVNTKADCYHALGIVHSMWTLVDGRFKDYISMPKFNQYMSLHTSVIGPEREHFEVQIRTYEMDRIAEEGIAAHWKYKEGNIAPSNEAKSFSWLRELMDFQQDLNDPKEFLNSVKVDLFSDDIYVFTPENEIKALPQGSTPIDFAYAIHSEVGDHCGGAVVNGVMVPLRTQLKTGDRVDIIYKENQKPKSDWLQMVASNRARNRITKYLNQVERETHKQIGAQLLEKGLRKNKISPNIFEKVPETQKLYSSLKVQNHEGMLIALGNEKVKIETIIEKLQIYLPQQSEVPEPAPAPPISRDERIVDNLSKRSQSNVVVDGIDNLGVHFAKCCSPVPGEPIVGFVTRGRGLVVHHVNCPRMRNLEPERQISCHWDPKVATSKESTRYVNLRVMTTDRIGILVDVTKVMQDLNINISQSHCRTLETAQSVLAFEVQIRDIKQLQQLIQRIERVPSVVSAERVSG
ncbi:MAG: bifunctional (p)ppGpp synthetase/guanosine-3',5'-bis(diphosphate) 3'-pyrophosphohydrolase [Bradymonadales bacterium]|jgi:guanosine-3',5'-bis(diphosphate) 3'-pyrophosphohydrolase